MRHGRQGHSCERIQLSNMDDAFETPPSINSERQRCQGRAGVGKKVTEADLGHFLVSPWAHSAVIISAQTETSCEQGASCPP